VIIVSRLCITDDKYRKFGALIRYDGTLYWVKLTRKRQRHYLPDGYPSFEGAISAIRKAMEATV
jgi:hypothetical protein